MQSPEPSPMPVACPRCDSNVIGTPAGYVVHDVPREGPAERVTLLWCPRNHPIVVVQDDLIGDNSYDLDPPHRVFPSPDRALSLAIPADLRTAHEEARKTFHAKSYVGTVVMCGRTLEGVCAEQGVDGGSLQKSLKKMKDIGYLDERL